MKRKRNPHWFFRVPMTDVEQERLEAFMVRHPEWKLTGVVKAAIIQYLDREEAHEGRGV